MRKAALTKSQIDNNDELEQLGTYTSYEDDRKKGPCTSLEDFEVMGPEGNLSLENFIKWVNFVEHGDPDSRDPTVVFDKQLNSLYTDRCAVEYFFNVLEHSNNGDSLKKRIFRQYEAKSADVWFKNAKADDNITEETDPSKPKIVDFENDGDEDGIGFSRPKHTDDAISAINDILLDSELSKLRKETSLQQLESQKIFDSFTNHIENLYGSVHKELFNTLSSKEIENTDTNNMETNHVNYVQSYKQNSNYVLNQHEKESTFSICSEKFETKSELSKNFTKVKNFIKFDQKGIVLKPRVEINKNSDELPSTQIPKENEIKEKGDSDNTKGESLLSLEEMNELDEFAKSKNVFADLKWNQIPKIKTKHTENGELNTLQLKMYHLILQSIQEHKHCLFQVLGPPGAGKSVLIMAIKNTLEEHLDKYFLNSDLVTCCEVTAYTGIAASNVKGSTVFRSVGIQCRSSNGVNSVESNFKRLDPIKLLYLKNKYLYLALFVIDEISFFTDTLLDRTHQRLQEIRSRFKEPFGGCCILLTGDFNQLPPCSGRNLVHAVQDPENNTIKGGKTKGYGVYNSQFNGGQLFALFETMFLVESQRSKDDVEFFNLYMSLCDDTQDYPVKPALMKSLKVLSKEDIENDPLRWLLAPTIVTNNYERRLITKLTAINFAIYFKLPVLKIQLPIANKNLPESLKNNLYFYFEDKLDFYFVVGLPGVILKNINVDCEIANGTKCIFHSINIINKEDRLETEKKLAAAQPGEIVTYTGKTYIDGISVYVPHITRENMSNSDISNLTDKIDCSSNFDSNGKFIITINLGFDTEEINIPKYIVNTLKPFSFKSQNYGLASGLASTANKCQGLNIADVIIDVSKQPSSNKHRLKQVSVPSLLVAISRVGTRENIRILPSIDKIPNYDHLYALKQDPLLRAYYHSLIPKGNDPDIKVFDYETCQKYLKKDIQKSLVKAKKITSKKQSDKLVVESTKNETQPTTRDSPFSKPGPKKTKKGYIVLIYFFIIILFIIIYFIINYFF